jgi:mono/diheme cytochrome c family protein
MMRARWKNVLVLVVILAVLGAGVFWLVTAPSTIPASALTADYKPNLANGKTMFDVGGCVSCHKTPGQDDRLKLGGGLALGSPFGTFHPPNISPDKTNGIGGWSEPDFVNALLRGVGPGGEHLYPSLPYTSYQRMSINDVRDLHAYLMTLEPVAAASRPHEIPFPFNIRRLLGGWKLLFVDQKPFVPDPNQSAEWNRGAYLVEGPGHCAECHSPRNALGAIEPDKRFSGGPDLEGGKGFAPNITPHADGIGKWSKDEIAEFLKSGFTPEFDAAGGSMAEVIRNTGLISDADRMAMATYIASLPARPGKAPPRAGSSTP